MPLSANKKAEAKGFLDKRTAAVENARKIVEKAKAENRDLSAEEEQQFDGFSNEAKEAKIAYDKAIKNQRREDWLADQMKSLDDPANQRITDPSNHAGNPDIKAKKTLVEWNPTNRFSPQFRAPHANRKLYTGGVRASERYNEAWNTYLKQGDYRNLMKIRNTMRSDEDERGGYFVASEQFATEMLKEVDDATHVQQFSRVYVVRKAKSLGVGKRTSKFSAWNWGSELHDVSEHMDESLKYGKRKLEPHYVSGAARISRDLLRSSVMPIESMVIGEAKIDLAELLETAYLFGHGAQMPLGVFVPSNEGISTARDVASIAADVNTDDGELATTHFGFNTFIRAKYNQKLRYRYRSRWMLHRNTIAKVSQIRDNEGQYIWQPSKIVGDPDTILGLPVDESEWVPNTYTASNYFGILADWSFYWIVFSLEFEMQRLVEIRARNNQVEYLMRSKLDAMPMLEEAFTRLKFADS
jgi:HK97 family phage major capsid protein